MRLQSAEFEDDPVLSRQPVRMGTSGMDDPGDLNVVDGAGGWAVEVSSNRESIKVVPDRSQVLGESVGKSPASFTDVKFVASGANDGVDHVGRYTGEVVIDLEHAGRSINGGVSVLCDVLACVTPATPATKRTQSISSVVIDGCWCRIRCAD